MHDIMRAAFDSLSLPHHSTEDIDLREYYILMEWVAVAGLISAAGGLTDRVLSIIESFGGEYFNRMTSYLERTHRLRADEVDNFSNYTIAKSEVRRDEYDALLKKDDELHSVADCAISHISLVTLEPTQLEDCTNALRLHLKQGVMAHIKLLKRIL